MHILHSKAVFFTLQTFIHLHRFPLLRIFAPTPIKCFFALRSQHNRCQFLYRNKCRQLRFVCHTYSNSTTSTYSFTLTLSVCYQTTNSTNLLLYDNKDNLFPIYESNCHTYTEHISGISAICDRTCISFRVLALSHTTTAKIIIVTRFLV